MSKLGRPGQRLLNLLKPEIEPTRHDFEIPITPKPKPMVKQPKGPTLGGNSRAGFTKNQLAAQAEKRQAALEAKATAAAELIAKKEQQRNQAAERHQSEESQDWADKLLEKAQERPKQPQPERQAERQGPARERKLTRRPGQPPVGDLD